MLLFQLSLCLLYVLSFLAAGSMAAATKGTSDYSWECGQSSEINVEDCEQVIDDIRSLGGEDDGWWTVRQYFCHEWEHETCKATFCPLAYPDNGLKIRTEHLAGALFWSLEVLCGIHGKQGMIKPDNSSWELYLSDSTSTWKWP